MSATARFRGDREKGDLRGHDLPHLDLDERRNRTLYCRESERQRDRAHRDAHGPRHANVRRDVSDPE